MKEREGNEGIADDTKQQGTTERGGRKHGQKAKEEHPAAPEPVIGMNDERARVRGDFFAFVKSILIPFLSCRRAIDIESRLFGLSIQVVLYSTKWSWSGIVAGRFHWRSRLYIRRD
jgi:hypothetical protein